MIALNKDQQKIAEGLLSEIRMVNRNYVSVSDGAIICIALREMKMKFNKEMV